jgi:osmotically-inducible protein OsmY
VSRRAFAAVCLASLVAACDPVTGTVVLGGAAGVGVGAAQERGFEGGVDDTKIKAEVSSQLFKQSFDMFRDVSLTVIEGRVMLTGIVKTDDQRAEAVRLTWQAAGVREVIDELQVNEGGGFLDYSRDVRIANELRSQLMFDKYVKNVNYNVDAVNGVVYVMGIAQDQDELDRVLSHARDISGVKRVVNHVVLKTDPKRQAS